MATVSSGNVVIFGAGGPVGAAAIVSLKDRYTLRVTVNGRGGDFTATESARADSQGIACAARE